MPGDVRLAELLGALSIACDVAFGFPLEKAMRSCVFGVELGRRHGLSDDVLRDVYYTALLGYLGATANGDVASKIACDDDIGLNRNLADMISDPAPGRMPRFLGKLAKGAAFAERTRALARAFFDREIMAEQGRSMCDASVHLARLVGMSSGVTDALNHICETWDGSHSIRNVTGEALALPIRVKHIACFGEVAHHRDGRDAAKALVKKQTGKHFDLALARTFLRDADEILAVIEGGSIWERFLEAEPRPHAMASEHRIDDIAKAFAELTDLKSGYTLGHSTGVAALAVRAAPALSLSDEETTLLRRAALLHDIGRVSASNRVWDKPAKLSPTEWEAVRMHAYWTERVLSRTAPLREAAQVASAAHERLDGGGYHRAVPGQMLTRAARILAAADAYHAMREPRAYRPAKSASEAAAALLEDVAAGRLDRDATHAVLEAAGVDAPRAPATWPCGLTDREVEVLRLVARGQSNKEIAVSLGISPRTAQHHVIHIYQKIEVSSRAAASLFATENGLLDV